MRIVYPSLTAGDYLNIIRAKAVKERRAKPLFPKKRPENAPVYVGILSAVICAVGILSLVLRLSRLWVAVVSALSFVLFVVVTVTLIKKDRSKVLSDKEAVNEPEPWEVDSELLSFYVLCDCIRYSGIDDATIHIEESECQLDFTYSYEGEKKKASLKMEWHLSEYVDDLLIDFERRCVTVPKTLCKVIEKNGGVLK